MPEVVAVTTEQMWTVTLVAGALVFVLGSAAVLRVRLPFPARLPSVLLFVGMAWFASLYGWAAWAFWWLARRLYSLRPVVLFLVLGGLLSVPGHLYDIYGRGLIEGCAVVR
jgi:hypothetical protein